MNLEKLFTLQCNYEKSLENLFEVKDNHLFHKKVLGLQVSISILAEKTNCFKFWQVNESYNKPELLDNYTKSLNYLLSIGIEKEFTDIHELSCSYLSTNMVDQFLNIGIDFNDLVVCYSRDHYITLFEDFLNLGISLGFTEVEISEHFENRLINKEFMF